MSWLGNAANWLRDALNWPPWGEIGIAAGVLASILAVIGFVFWVTEQRRRPEVEFLWKISTSSAEDDLVEWEPSWLPTVSPGASILVESSVKNVGDAATSHAMTNFVAPASVSMRQVVGSAPSQVPTVVGGAPITFISDTFELPPGTWRMQRFELTCLINLRISA